MNDISYTANNCVGNSITQLDVSYFILQGIVGTTTSCAVSCRPDGRTLLAT